MEIFQKKLNNLGNLIISNKGIGLIETILAVMFSIFLIIALVTLTNFNIRNSTLADENQKAINSANSLVESLRSLNDLVHFIKNMIKLQICDFILAKTDPSPKLLHACQRRTPL